MIFAIKAAIEEPRAEAFEFAKAKTMYAGKRIQAGDTIYVFASENEGGSGLIARGTVTKSDPTPRLPDVERQTPCVSITINRTETAQRRLGRSELKAFANWSDGHPAT